MAYKDDGVSKGMWYLTTGLTRLVALYIKFCITKIIKFVQSSPKLEKFKFKFDNRTRVKFVIKLCIEYNKFYSCQLAY